jgi:hypothetical protein
MGDLLQTTHDNPFWHNNAIINFVHTWTAIFLKHPREYVRNGLVLGLGWTSCRLSSTCTSLVCPGPPSILMFVPTIHVSHMYPPLPTGQLNSSAQVNNMAVLHHIYTVTLIYITFTLLSIPFFILLPSFQEGRLAPIPLSGTLTVSPSSTPVGEIGSVYPGSWL